MALLVLFFSAPAFAEKGTLLERLTPEVMAVVFPEGAEKFGPEEGDPPAIAVYKDGKVAGHVFSTLDIIAAPGYVATPFDVIAGVDLTGHITGAKVVFHRESFIVHDPVRQRLLDTFLAREAGRHFTGGGDNVLPPDYVSAATVSARAMRGAVLTTAALVFRARNPRSSVKEPTLDIESYRMMSFDDLLAEGSVVKKRVTAGEVKAALAAQGAEGTRLEWPLGRDEDLYIEFMTALITPPVIGGNLLGMVKFEDYKQRVAAGRYAIFIASNGPYDFIGTKYFRASEGNRFDRIRVVQGEKTFEFVQNDYEYAAPFSGQQLAGLFALPADSGFDPIKPWRLEVLVNGAGAKPVQVSLPLEYKVPDSHVLMPEPEPPPPVPPWVEAWNASGTNILILSGLLSVLTLIFVFQDSLAKSRIALTYVRKAFLLVVLVWLGWIANVQLSIVNVMNYGLAPFKHFDAGFYLAEPLMLIIAIFTLLSVLLIGRGVFCGWLCPFGALQELLASVAKWLRLPQWNPSPKLEQRLWMGKYISAAVVLFLVISEIDGSGATLEIEPFKTAITAKFVREWPYVIYAGILLAAGLFSERAYCRFLCPLGGVLAALDRLHLLNRLKRRPECGSPCHLCERSCPVRAIRPTGKITTAECFQCLDCQVEYYDDKRCPPLVQAAKIRAMAKPVPVAEHA